ncbi:MAG: peptidase [Actinomycetia bacterium]|nr:peptidase [Actinomycetes bacterium]
MRIRTEFPRKVVVHDDVRIPMRDGATLSARLWLPEDAVQSPVPALVEYLPYRKSDWTAPRDAQRHPWYAGHGYASIRIDMRGCGDSDGLMTDEYTPQEQQDAEDALAWIAAQPWCTGRTGMFGISWGGFNSLQVAALRPPSLKAIVTVCSTDDRYADDVHYFGGSLLGVDMASWAATMLSFQSRPPDPAVVGERWRQLWLERLEGLHPFIETWLGHQERDDYWRQGSVCEDYDAITAAVYAVGGWADPYRNTVFRLLENLRAPAKGLVGPWAHRYPDIATAPGPAIGFLQETLRWWDHWLKDIDTGIMDEPRLRSWLPEAMPPRTTHGDVPGRWVTDPLWPSPHVSPRSWRLEDAGLVDTGPVHGGTRLVASPQHTGIDAGRFFPFGNPSDLPPDQRAEDGRSVCFDTAPLTDRVEILGIPAAELELACELDAGQVIVRLCDVAPDGSSTLVTRGCLNLTHRTGHDSPTPWVPGSAERVIVELSAIGYCFPPGHRIRIAVSSAYWPWVWPHAEAAPLTLHLGQSTVVLPVRDAGGDLEPPPFEEPENATPLQVTTVSARTRPERQVIHDVETGTWELRVDPDYGGSRIFPDGLTYQEEALDVFRIRQDDPLSARAESTWRTQISRDGWCVRVETRSIVSATKTHFLTENTLTASEGEREVFARTWTAEVPRTSA